MANNGRDVNRRNVLKGIGATGLGAFGIGPASAEEAEEDIDITSPSGHVRNRIIASARADERTRKLTKTLKREGYVPDPRDIKVGVTRQDGKVHHRTVLFSFTSKEKNDGERFVYWTDLEDEPEIPPVANLTITGPSDSANREVILRTAEDGIVSREQVASGSRTDSATGPSIQSHGGCVDGCPCCKDGLTCESWNYACIAYVVLTAAGTVIGCGSCLPSVGGSPACWACLFTVLGNTAGYFADVGCYVGNNCSVEPVCTNPRMC